MDKSIFFCFRRSPSLPYAGAIGWVNSCVAKAAQEIGWRTRIFSGTDIRENPKGIFSSGIPVDKLTSRLNPPKFPQKGSHIICYTEDALCLLTPKRFPGHKNAVLFHSLVSNSNTYSWIEDPALDCFLTYSNYMARSIRAILSAPNWTEEECLHSQIPESVCSMIAPLPCLEYPAGYDTDGYPLPPSVCEALDSNDIVGSCIQPGKSHYRALYAILFFLNELARKTFESKRRYRMILSFVDYYRLLDLRERSSHKLDLEKIAIPVRQLKNKDVVKILKRSQFALAYNEPAEAFGFHPLECVYYGCPVYTNGAGNNRFLLPPDHGIYVYETEQMYFGQLSAYMRVAEMIHANVLDRKAVSKHCLSGKKLISSTFTWAHFITTFKDFLALLDQNDFPKHSFLKRRFEQSPFLRSWNPKTRNLVSDVGYRTLSKAQADCFKAIQGMTTRKAQKDFRLSVINDLFLSGAISVTGI